MEKEIKKCPTLCGKKYKSFDENRVFRGWFCSTYKKELKRVNGACIQLQSCIKARANIEGEKNDL